jgi:hypothetical protein
MSLEALYVVEFGDVAGRGYRNGGTAVFETGRIFGGDSGYYYLGTYTIDKDQLSARARIVKHNPSWVNAFGDASDDFEITVIGTRNGNTITGQMQRSGTGIILPIRLIRKAELP